MVKLPPDLEFGLTTHPVAKRDEILAKVREALGKTSKLAPDATFNPPAPPCEGAFLDPILPAEWLALFETEIQQQAGVTHRVSSVRELDQVLQGILPTAEAEAIALSRNPAVIRLRLAEKLEAWGKKVCLWPETAGADAPSSFRSQCFSAHAGITGVEFALVESGALILTSRSEGSQLISLAPRIHIALYRRSQLVGTLEEVLNQLQARQNPGRSVVFITGPSRTADIEQISVRGVHGPLEVHAVLVEESCFWTPSGG